MAGISSFYTVGGLNHNNMPAMNVSMRGMAGISGFQKRNAPKRKKPLNYNPKQLSAAIMRASKAQSAGKAMVMAKNKLNALLKCKGSGQYNEREVEAAIAHAKRMVKCAQLKTQNLRQEEQNRKRVEQEAKAELRQEKSKARAEAARREQQMEQKQHIERMNLMQKQKSQRRELIRKRKFHRSEEQSKLTEADIAYLKEQSRGFGSYSGSLAGAPAGMHFDVTMPAVQMTEAQMEQQIAQELAALEQAAGGAMSGMTGSGSGAAGAAGSAVSQAAGSSTAVGINIIV